jgi:DNA-damage-inducible protein D
MSELKAKEYKRFEDIKIARADGSEYWPARELALVLEYAQWRNFAKVLERAMLACRKSGFDIADHFAEVSKTIKMPKGAKKEVKDYELTRYACYLIVQNGDPRKEVIALGQTYFAIQTYRQEIADKFNLLDESNKRVCLLYTLKQKHLALCANTAKDVMQ